VYKDGGGSWADTVRTEWRRWKAIKDCAYLFAWIRPWLRPNTRDGNGNVPATIDGRRVDDARASVVICAERRWARHLQLNVIQLELEVSTPFRKQAQLLCASCRTEWLSRLYLTILTIDDASSSVVFSPLEAIIIARGVTPSNTIKNVGIKEKKTLFIIRCQTNKLQ